MNPCRVRAKRSRSGDSQLRTRERRGRIGRNRRPEAEGGRAGQKIPFFKPSKEWKDFVIAQSQASSADALRAAIHRARRWHMYILAVRVLSQQLNQFRM